MRNLVLNRISNRRLAIAFFAAGLLIFWYSMPVQSFVYNGLNGYKSLGSGNGYLVIGQGAGELLIGNDGSSPSPAPANNYPGYYSLLQIAPLLIFAGFLGFGIFMNYVGVRNVRNTSDVRYLVYNAAGILFIAVGFIAFNLVMEAINGILGY